MFKLYTENKFSRFLERKWSLEIYVLILAIITILGWCFSSAIGMGALIVLAIIVLLLTNDLMNIIPMIVFFLFNFNEGFSNKEIPIILVVLGSIFALVLIIHLFRNKVKLSKMKSAYGLIGLAFVNLLPIFWNKTITEGYEIFYFLFFANLAYLFVYFLVVNGIRKVNLRMLFTTFSMLGIILAAECCIKAIRVLPEFDSIFNVYYHLGWGLCNEAGIMICFSIPFIFYLIAKSDEVKEIIWNLVKLLIALVGLILTTSRGAYLCGFAEVGILAIILLFKANLKKQYRTIFFVCLFGFIAVFLLGYKYTFPLIKKAIDTVFVGGLDDNGRVEIWQKGFNAWLENPLTIILGSGMCSVLEVRESGVDGDIIMQLVPLVFHSTFVETLVMGGILGLVCLVIHFIEKYRAIIKVDKLCFYTIGIGMILLDLYGMIDNTYHMYYFMIPLVMMLAVFDNYNWEK